jgi:hypothetical protein
MGELAMLLAKRARRAALIQAVRGRPDLTIDQLQGLLTDHDYSDELAEITIEELMRADTRTPLEVRPGEPLDVAVMRVFQQLPARELASGFFCRYMGLERWTAQKLLADLAARGLLVRSGKTSSTRYVLPIRTQMRS